MARSIAQQAVAPTVSAAMALALALLMQGCSSAPAYQNRSGSVQPGAAVGSEMAMRAMALLGAPYRYGGAGPRSFDCSGLVRYVHAQLGIEVPRTAAQQYATAAPVDLDELQPGDLLFFRIEGRVSHVAIYTGAGRFIHAPQTGRNVELRTLDDGYYRPRLASAGRLF